VKDLLRKEGPLQKGTTLRRVRKRLTQGRKYGEKQKPRKDLFPRGKRRVMSGAGERKTRVDVESRITYEEGVEAIGTSGPPSAQKENRCRKEDKRSK